MEATGIIQKEDGPTASVNSMVVNEKRCGKLRICIDPRDLNNAILREHYQLPTQQEIASRLTVAKYFSKLDATSGFWQMPLDEESYFLTTFNTPFGRYRFTVVPFGVVFAQEVFHKTVHDQFRDIPGCETDIDDILIWGRTIDEHDGNLEHLLNRVSQITMKLSREKCQFRQTEITYLGECLTQHCVKPDAAKIKAINDYVKASDKQCFPIIKTRVSSRDPPFLSPIVKHLLKLRKNAINKRDNESSHRLQERINKLIRSNQLKAVKQENKNQNCGSKRWWSLVNKITGRCNSEVPLSHIIDPKVMNEHFQSINTDPDYVTPQPLHIPRGARVPELCVHTICKLLLNQNRTTSGPDELPRWFWNTYAYDIAPVLTIIFNSSIKLGIVPDSWKLENVLPVPK